MLKISSNYIK